MSYLKKNLLWFLSLTTIFIYTSCDSKTFFFEKNSIEKDEWNLNSPVVFDVNIMDTLMLYDFFINIRNTNDYPYSNVFFFLKTTFPSGAVAHDTIECMLADKEGKWYGKGSGRIFDHMFLFKERVIFPMQGKYQFQLIHGMRDTIIQGVSEVGLKIDYVNR